MAPKNTKLFAVVIPKLFPDIVIVVPIGPDAGDIDVMDGGDVAGGAKYVKPGIANVPCITVKETVPVAPFATVAVILILLTMVKDAAAIPPNFTAITPLNP